MFECKFKAESTAVGAVSYAAPVPSEAGLILRLSARENPRLLCASACVQKINRYIFARKKKNAPAYV